MPSSSSIALRLRKTPFTDPGARLRAGRFGMAIFLVSLGVLFAATVVGYVVVRVQLGRDELWPGDLPPLPWPLAVSTAVLLASSGTMHGALKRTRADGPAAVRSLRRALAATAALGVVFLAIQIACWFWWRGVIETRWVDSAADSDAWRFALTGFYLLSGLHALHVVGGLVALAVALARARRAVDARDLHGGVLYCAMYWHFLDAVWLALYALLLIGS